VRDFCVGVVLDIYCVGKWGKFSISEIREWNFISLPQLSQGKSLLLALLSSLCQRNFVSDYDVWFTHINGSLCLFEEKEFWNEFKNAKTSDFLLGRACKKYKYNGQSRCFSHIQSKQQTPFLDRVNLKKYWDLTVLHSFYITMCVYVCMCKGIRCFWLGNN